MIRTSSMDTFKRSISTRIGKIDYTLEDVFYFKNGLLGFSDLRNFIVTKPPCDNVPEEYMCLQSMEQEDLTLIIADAAVGHGGEQIINAIDLKEHLQDRHLEFEDIAVFLIATTHQDAGKKYIWVNTRAPIIIAPNHKEGWQVVLESDTHEVSYCL